MHHVVCSKDDMAGNRLLLYNYLLLFIIYIRQSQQTEVFLLGALNDYEHA